MRMLDLPVFQWDWQLIYDTKDVRLSLEYNFNEHAVKRDICILPLCLLFEYLNISIKRFLVFFPIYELLKYPI